MSSEDVKRRVQNTGIQFYWYQGARVPKNIYFLEKGIVVVPCCITRCPKDWTYVALALCQCAPHSAHSAVEETQHLWHPSQSPFFFFFLF